ncbi:anthocyanidin 3-O-glucosyltransferase 5-like [Cornus florida]|uniref:anthocyanidin 3-O-glucosyltransferase 5-like n=1 Tax=Cornus florida TaxID=4283 RepID=UPI00289FCC73|nr:anthocyanidin 3-O-glucosyltransferase 5-like [Cornus florida]
MATTKPHAALLASPGMGHLIPVIELANRLFTHHNFDVTVFTISTGTSPATQSQHLTSNLFNVVTLPPIDISGSVDPNADISIQLLAMMRQSIPSLRSAINSMKSRPTALVVDFFSTASLAMADEFGMLKYVYMPNAALFAAMTLYAPAMNKNVESEFDSENELLTIPGCRPLRFDDLVDAVQDRTGQMFDDYARVGAEMSTADAVLVNTWQDLDAITIGALRNHKVLRETIKVPVYPVGPLTRQAQPSDSRSGVLDWLDMQSRGSVLYVSFGSGGTLSSQQMTEMAWGLELSRQRFVWVVRPPMENGALDYLNATNGCDGSLDFLPNGFLARTKDVGLVIPMWAQQAEILAHTSVGGFLSHCGWNSTLESIVNGVPLIAWPLFAEQSMNAAFLTEEVGVAYRPKVSPSKGVVMREEIEKMVRLIMEDNGMNSKRAKAKELEKSAVQALSKGGSSYNSLSQVAKNCQMKLNEHVICCD